MGEDDKYRYEFRVFGPDTADVSRILGLHMEAQGSSESGCAYLLGAGSASTNLKIRDSRLESKVCVQTTHDGLQQWRPDLSEPFPLEPQICDRLFGIQCDDALSSQRLLDEIGAPEGQVVCLHVRKRRQHFERGSLMGEACEILINGAYTESIAVESTSAAAVREMRAALGLDEEENVSYVRALSRFAGLEPLPLQSPWRFDADGPVVRFRND